MSENCEVEKNDDYKKLYLSAVKGREDFRCAFKKQKYACKVLQKKVEILTKACEKIELTATLREDNLAITARRALKECKELG